MSCIFNSPIAWSAILFLTADVSAFSKLSKRSLTVSWSLIMSAIACLSGSSQSIIFPLLLWFKRWADTPLLHGMRATLGRVQLRFHSPFEHMEKILQLQAVQNRLSGQPRAPRLIHPVP